MHVCLAITPFFQLERLHPPLGIAYLAAIARKSGHTCTTLDLRMRFEASLDETQRQELEANGQIYFKPVLPPEILDLLLPAIIDWASEIVAEKPSILGLSCFRSTRLTSLALATAVKRLRPETFVLLGGPDCTLNYEEVLECTAVDAVVIGDGEEAFACLLNALENGSDLAKVPNLARKTAAAVQRSSETRRASLDSFLLPDFEGLPLEQYWSTRQGKPPMLPIVWQRGCVANCTFCNEREFWPTVSARPSAHVGAEMRSHHRQFGVSLFEFYDLSINNDARLLAELCTELRAQPIRFQWFGMARFARSLTNELIDQMGEAGCIHLSFGLESGSSSVLRHMRKHHDTEDTARILQRMRQNGIETHCMVIVGYPTETEDDFDQTIQFLKENQSHITSVNLGSTCSIKPGTPLWGMTEELGIRFDERGGWHRGENTPAVRLDRLRRLQEAVSSMAFERSAKYDVLTEYKREKIMKPLTQPLGGHHPVTRVVS
jgi:radical SAM superfamily enzyme YgiQ (UPF0313 family)